MFLICSFTVNPKKKKIYYVDNIKHLEATREACVRFACII